MGLKESKRLILLLIYAYFLLLYCYIGVICGFNVNYSFCFLGLGLDPDGLLSEKFNEFYCSPVADTLDFFINFIKEFLDLPTFFYCIISLITIFSLDASIILESTSFSYDYFMLISFYETIEFKFEETWDKLYYYNNYPTSICDKIPFLLFLVFLLGWFSHIGV